MADTLERLKGALSDRYAIQRELGQGGMATVWLATDLRHHRDVALKVLRPELAVALGPERFLREIALAARLTHPNILPVHDSGEAAGLLYYVMPYVEGESLRQRLRREKQFSVDEALRISREVAEALSYAHAHGVIHRDIKPENILLESGHAVVADFGIAKAVEQAGEPALTGTGVALGTPAYMSPEQAAGSKEVDGRSDLYSLACVLFEMLAGRPPFVASSPESVLYQHLAAPPPLITSLRPAVPAHVAATLERALAKVPADRFNPVALFVEALGPGGTAVVAAAAAPKVASPRSSRSAAVVAVTALVAVAGLVAGAPWLRRLASGPREPAHPRTAIAVLPLQNLSGEGPYAYFAGGLHDELLTQLTKVAALKVIGRTSVLTYEGTSKRLSQIGAELKVGSVVEGSVQVVGDRLRVNVQLIDPVTQTHLWAERYDRALDDAFAVQSDIAQQIVRALNAALTQREAAAIADVPTENAQAYQLYLQGLEYSRRGGRLRENLEAAQHLYERALALDSTFVQAHARLSVVHGEMSWYGFDPSAERLQRQRTEAEVAVRLGPDVPQAHYAIAMWQYRGRRDWQEALAVLRVVAEKWPGDADVSQAMAAVYRRLGEWRDAEVTATRAAELNPRSEQVVEDLLGGTRLVTRRYAQAVEAYDRAIHFAPNLHLAAARKGEAFLLWQGVPDTLRAALDRLPQDTDLGGPMGTERALRAELLLLERKPDNLLALVHNLRRPVLESQNFYIPAAFYEGFAHRLGGEEEAAQRSFESSRGLLDSVSAEFPEDWRVHAARGLCLALLGLRREALGEAEWLERSSIYEQDAFLGPRLVASRALILAHAGDVAGAVREIERVLSGPGWLSAHTLRMDPRWDVIRGDPRFRALLAKYAEPKPVW